jgi:uncharacterized protein YejL (UPF0352 family)
MKHPSSLPPFYHFYFLLPTSRYATQDTFQTSHRCFLRNAKHHTLPFSKEIQQKLTEYSRERYHMIYLRDVVLPSGSGTLTMLLERNQSQLIELITQKNTIRKLVGMIIPLIVSVNEKIVYISKPDEQPLMFLKELFGTGFSDKAVNRLIRKLYDERLYETLDYAFTVSTSMSQHSIVTLLIDLFILLHDRDPIRMNTFLCDPDTKLISIIMAHLINNTEYHFHYVDHVIGFLEHVSYNDPMKHNQIIHVIEPYISSLIRTNHEHTHKIYNFIAHLFQMYPETRERYLQTCVTTFIQRAERFYRETCTTSQKLAVTSAARIIAPYDIPHRTGMTESIMAVLLTNQGRDNMVSSMIQVMIGNMVTHFLTSFVNTQARHLISRLPHDVLQKSLQQVVSAVQDSLLHFQRKNTPTHRKPMLNRIDSMDVYRLEHVATEHVVTEHVEPNKTKPLNAEKREAVQRMAHVLTIMAKRRQTMALGRLRRNVKANDESSGEFLMDAVYVLAHKRMIERKRMMTFVIRTNLIPLLRRIHLKDAFQQWKTSCRKITLTLPKYKQCVVQPIQIETLLDTYGWSASSRSSTSSGDHHISRMPSLIGEEIGKKNDFFFNIETFM